MQIVKNTTILYEPCSSSSLVIPVINLLIRVKDIKKALFDLIYCQRMSIFDVY